MTSFWKKFNSTQVKLNLTAYITSLTNAAPHRLPNGLRFRISENQKISEKTQNFTRVECSAKYQSQNRKF